MSRHPESGLTGDQNKKAMGRPRGSKASFDERRLKLLRIANKRQSLTSNGYDTLRDPNHFVSVGVGVFQSNPYIGCAEGREYARLVITQLDALLKLN